MEHSQEARIAALELTLHRTLDFLRGIEPTATLAIYSDIIAECSEKLEKKLDPQTKEIHDIVSEWQRYPSRTVAQPEQAAKFMGLLEAQACARLAFNMLTWLMWRLDEKHPEDGVAGYVLNSAIIHTSKTNQEMGGDNPLVNEMLRILRGTPAKGKTAESTVTQEEFERKV